MKKPSAISGRILGLAAISAFAAFSQAQPITVHVNGQQVQFDSAEPHMMGDKVMIPIRKVIEQAGGTVDWRSTDKTVVCQLGTTNIEVTVPTATARVNGTETALDGPVHIEDGTTIVPARFLADSIGATVEYDNNDLVLMTNEPTMYPSTTDITPTPQTAIPDNTTNNNLNKGDSSTITTPTTNLMLPEGSALRARLDQELNSKDAYVGQTFTATLDTSGQSDYFGIPQGAKVEGHVTFVQPMRDGVPGIIGIAFDDVLLDNGRMMNISASSINADTDIDTADSGRLTTNELGRSRSDLKFVGFDSNTGVLVPLTTTDAVVTIDQLQNAWPSQGEPHDVDLTSGTLIGLRIDRNANFEEVPD